MSVRIVDLTKYLDGRLILDRVTMEVSVGEIVGFLGQNGAGKTTTLKSIVGVLSVDEGVVEVCGLKVGEQRLEVAAKIGYLPETNALYEEMYVREYLRFVAELRGMKNGVGERVNALIDQVGLEKEAHKRIGELSKGCKQRVGIAQALLSDPEVLILDEPTSGLDPLQMAEIRGLIRRVAKNKTVIFSSHNLQEVQEICSRVVLIREGRVVADVEDVANWQVDEARKLELEVEFERAMSVGTFREMLPESVVVEPMGEKGFVISAEEDVRRLVFDLAVKSDNALLRLQTRKRSLEEAFREYTSGK